MNTNNLKRFAQQTRRKLLEQVAAKMEQVLHTDSAELREKAGALRKLQEAINATSKEQVIDKVAYTWFNRLMALRFMDANDYQPIGMRVVTPKPGYTLPELLDEAKQGNIPAELPVNTQHIYDLFDGRFPSDNPQNEAYKELLIGACNHLSATFPFLFEHINDYTELLLPDDLLSEFSIVHDIREGMTAEECREVEIIGWLYQFYVSEKKDEVFAAKSKVRKEDIPAATQLFTPRWIVEYMVQNTLGKLWLQNRPDSRLQKHMPYFIDSPSLQAEDYLHVDSIEEIKLLDQACGSGHILVYAFELFTKIYEEEGYNPGEIPQLIIKKNLYGFEIDERAAQLAGLALMMKARSYQRRVFKKNIKPNILCFNDLLLDTETICDILEELDIDTIDEKAKKYKVDCDSGLYKQFLDLQNIKYDYSGWNKLNKKQKKELVKKTGMPSLDYHDLKGFSAEYFTRLSKNLIKLGIELIEPQSKQYRGFSDWEIIRAFKSVLYTDVKSKLFNDFILIQQATNFGSLIQPQTPVSELEKTKGVLQKQTDTADLFLKHKIEALITALSQLIPLANKYHCVVDNPPYMGGGNMNKELSAFVKKNYPDSKADLMACFMETGLQALKPKGFLGMINQHSWMFLSSYEKLREKLIKSTFFDTLLHLGPRTFPEIGGEVVQNASYTFWNTKYEAKGSYIRLVDFGDSNLKREKTLEAIQHPNCGWFYTANQKDFEKIPGSPTGYWANIKVINLFRNLDKLGEISDLRSGISTGDNERFYKHWSEVELSKLRINGNISLINKNTLIDNKKWYSTIRGGTFIKWFGNQEYILNLENNGYDIRNSGKNYRLRTPDYYFRTGITWSRISSGQSAFRIKTENVNFGENSPSLFSEKIDLKLLLGILNSPIPNHILEFLSPTLSFQTADISKIPIPKNDKMNKEKGVINTCISISKLNWNSHETSWDFLQNEIVRRGRGQLVGGEWNEERGENTTNHQPLPTTHPSPTTTLQPPITLEEAYNVYKQYWQNQFYQLHSDEEELNARYIEIYGLQEELTPDVPLEDITILQQELDRKQLHEISENYKSGWQLENGKWQLPEENPVPELPFSVKEVMAQFVSYTVGCMFGRYSLDKPGLILANQGETLEDFYLKHNLSPAGGGAGGGQKNLTYLPDADNIIPVLDDEWFEDDITNRFYEFLKASFGKAHFERNIAFVEDALGKPIRKYFVKDFYTDHIKRYKKRPIYWMFSSPRGSFNVLIYMHRYTPDTLSEILNNYLKDFQEKLHTRVENLDHMIETGTSAEQTKAAREKDRIRTILLELQEYERELFTLASERITIDLDDGVLVNYNKFGKVIKTVPGLNDPKTKKKVKGFDWIDTTQIR